VPAAATPEDAKFVVAYREDIIEKKLKPFLALTKSFAGPNVIEMVCLTIFSLNRSRGEWFVLRQA
jgi:adenylyl cyclase-associated protein